jgi:2-C-methyl-D-erythritol 4-phosphate cytidylyltransferase
LESDPEAAGAIAAGRVADTIKRARRRVVSSPPESVAKGSAEVEETVERNDLWAAQTPQVFRAAALREAIAATPDGYIPTDESVLLERIGGRVLIHESSAENLKVTSPADLELAGVLLRRA